MISSVLKRLSAAVAVIVIATAAFAQDFPKRPITMIVPFAAGGTSDVIARAVAEQMGIALGQTIVIENVAGAGGSTALARASRAEPDGYTIAIGNAGTNAAAYTIYPKLPFTPESFVPIAMVAKTFGIIALRKDFPSKDLKEFIAYAKANPGKVTHGSQGNGSTSHLTGQMFATMTGADMLHIPFKGEGPALTELLGGRVDLFFGNISAVLKYRETKQVKLLGLAAPKRGSMAPDVPTVAEGGLADFNSSAWFALAAPPGTPAAIAGKLNAAMVDILNMPDVRERFAAQGAEVIGGTPAEMNAFLATERARWKKVIDTANVKLD